MLSTKHAPDNTEDVASYGLGILLLAWLENRRPPEILTFFREGCRAPYDFLVGIPRDPHGAPINPFLESLGMAWSRRAIGIPRICRGPYPSLLGSLPLF